MLKDEPSTPESVENLERNNRNEKETGIAQIGKDLDGEEGTNCFVDGFPTEGEELILGNKQERQEFLEKILEEIQQLLMMNDQEASHHKENNGNNDPFGNEFNS